MLLHKEMTLLKSAHGIYAESIWKITEGKQAGRYLSIFTMISLGRTVSRAQVMDISEEGIKVYIPDLDPRSFIISDSHGNPLAQEHGKAVIHFQKNSRWMETK